MFQFIRTDDSTRQSTVKSASESACCGGHAAEAAPPIAVTPDLVAEVAPAPKLVLDVNKLDRAGATASFLCAIHCAVMPLIVALLPLLGLSFLASEPVEWALLAASATLGSWSLCLGFRQHKSRRVFMILGVALALLVAGRIFHEPHLGGHHLHEHHYGIWGPILMVLGGLTMMSAHLLNHRLCHACKKCSADSCH